MSAQSCQPNQFQNLTSLNHRLQSNPDQVPEAEWTALQQDGAMPSTEEARIARAMNHLASPDFPPELLLMIVEAIVTSQAGH
jgi:hypothetical protein